MSKLTTTNESDHVPEWMVAARESGQGLELEKAFCDGPMGDN